jgi:hypothetical protein
MIWRACLDRSLQFDDIRENEIGSASGGQLDSILCFDGGNIGDVETRDPLSESVRLKRNYNAAHQGVFDLYLLGNSSNSFLEFLRVTVQP